MAAKASFEKNCSACSKIYYSENAFQNHLGSQKHKLRSAILSKNGGQTPTDDETASVMSSTISLGEPISTTIPAVAAVPVEVPAVSIDPEAEAEFSKVVDGIKDTKITEDEPLSHRPTRPHHSAGEQRPVHPLSPQKDLLSSATLLNTDTPTTEIPLRKCLFCNYDSPTFKLSVMHMTKYHSMFIPEQNYLVDLEGLISWLYGKIHDLHECLYCHKIKATPEATQTHMRDVGHCKIAFEAEQDMIEVGQFYDFSSTYSDPEEDDMLADSDDDGGVEVDTRKILKMVVSDENGDVEMANGEENGEGWETDSSASSLDTDELTAVPIDRRHMYKKERLSMHRHHSHDDPRPHRNADGFHSHAHQHHAAFHSDHELHLPSGRTAGHRSLNRYYRQNLHDHPSSAERVEQQRLLQDARGEEGEDENLTGTGGNDERGRQVAMRANGGLGMIGVSDQKRKEVAAVEKRETKRAQRAQKQYQWGVDKGGNSQKHFRDPLLQ